MVCVEEEVREKRRTETNNARALIISSKSNPIISIQLQLIMNPVVHLSILLVITGKVMNNNSIIHSI